MYKVIIAALFIALIPALGRAQAYNEVALSFEPTFGNKAVVFDNTYYHLSKSDSVTFEEFKCYISEIVFYKDGQPVFKEDNSFHLLDAQHDGSMSFKLKLPKDVIYNSLKMNIGVDSVTSTSGALGGDLDPANGMFWTWQSGYINMKLEGQSNLCPTRKHRFQFHLGGYMMS